MERRILRLRLSRTEGAAREALRRVGLVLARLGNSARKFGQVDHYVDERLRNRGIGGALLRYAEELARRSGAPCLSLETGITNPARRLYERSGYRIVGTKTDAVYEHLTGSPGRIVMVKELTPTADGARTGPAPPTQ